MNVYNTNIISIILFVIDGTIMFSVQFPKTAVQNSVLDLKILVARKVQNGFLHVDELEEVRPNQ